ncbi:cell adhesion molecule-related/down-regulated by oncogenes [Xenentodon cancila]
MDSGLRVLLSAVLWLSQSLLISGSSQSPSFHSEPASLVQSRGSAARLQCLVSPPSAAVTWRFQGLLLEQDTLPGVEFSEGSLTISSLTPSHAGTYQCVARLDHGPAVASRLARVAVAEISEYEDGGQRRFLSVQEGSTALIECPLPLSVPPARPRLRVRGDWIDVSTDDYVVLPSGNLQIISASAQHQGMYKCGAVNPVTGETVVQSHGTKLSVRHSNLSSSVRLVYPAGPVTFSMQQSQPLTLECVVSGSSATAAKWFKNGKELTPGPSHQRQHNNLVFVRLARSDEGRYTCAVETKRGLVISANYTVNVLEPVSITAGPGDQLVSSGSAARFTCVSRGNPSPNVTWLFNANPVPSSHRFQVSGSTLVITDVTSQDGGVYQCLLDNGIGSAQSHGVLTTRPGTSTPADSPQPDASPSLHPFQSDEGFLTEDEGDAAVLPPDRNSNRLTPEAPIIISPPQTHKPDVYDLEWRAGRDGGSPINAYFVKYRKVDEMGTVVGSWLTVRVPGSEKTLRLSELESSSLYEVLMVARSSAGEGQQAMLTFRTGREKSVSSNKNPSKPPVVSMPPKAPEERAPNTHFGVVIHDRVPEAPDRPTISMATESSAYVTWIPRANGGFPITAFRVEYRRGRSAEWLVAADNISPLKLSVEVRNLEPGSIYKFRVAAVNMYGESPQSIPSKPYQVPQASPRTSERPVVGPHISSTDAISDTQIMLRWTYSPSSNNNTPIQGFYIYYRPTDSDNDSDYKRDVVEGVKNWHMIAHLQPETSYDIKMQCFNDGGESEYSNVMICETRARQSPGSPSQHPITPSGPHFPEPPSPPGGLLYLIVGCVLGVMVLILLAFIAMCLWRNRQQNSMHKYDPPGCLYQPAEMNGHVLEYTTLAAGTGHINGAIHGTYGHSGQLLPQGCHHLHHKLPNGLALLNGSGGLFSPGHPHGHEGTLPHSTRDCEHSHPHRHLNGGGLYTALPQTESSDCMSCQNLCNNNRCYNKTNGTFSSGTLPLMHRMTPCQQDGLEMVPLGQVLPQCHGSDPVADAGYQPDEHKEPPPSQHSCCLIRNGESSPVDRTAEDELRCVDVEGPVVCWESLGLPDLDCDEKPGWISSSSLAGELIQPGPQEA